ncbi:hypothetical protein MY10362_008355 [Beauveria mimosiformis]
MNEVMLEMCDMNAHDVMTRHATLHGVVGKKPRKVSCLSCVKLKVRCDGEPGTTCTRCNAARRPCQYRSHVDGSTPVRTTGQTERRFASTDPAIDATSIQPLLSPTSGTRPANHDTPGAGGAVYELPALPVEGIVPTVNTVPGLSTDPSESFFGWDMGHVGSDDMDFLNASLLEWFPKSVIEERHESLQEPAGSDESESPSSQLMRDAQPHDTPWPHVYHPSGRDVQINLSPAAPKTPSILQQPQLGHATLLQSMFGLFCGSRMLYQHAEMSRGSLVTAARTMHLLRPGLSFVQELQKGSGTPTQKQMELATAADDERRSLGWGIYLYDTQISALLNIPPLFSISEINVPLPADLNATSNLQSTTESPPSFRAVLDTLLSTDAAAVEAIFTSTQSPGDSRYRLDFPATFKHAPAETVLCLDVALTFWAALKFSTNLGGVGGGGTRQKPFSIFWSNCDDASEWVKHGGAVYFQGLGELGELTSAKSLAIFRQRMDIMSWGLAERFKHVLLNLEQEEQAL